jgi:DNA invertase Pin-like site-specific DNA recombinase
MSDVREYRRLSADKGGASLQRQGRENKRAQVERDWTAGVPYSDNDRSASPYRKRSVREHFDLLLSDLQTGDLGAKILQAYETSRLTRETEEIIQLLKLCRAANVKIYITEHDRIYNPANARDRKDLKDSANDDEYSSDQTSMRVSDTAATAAEDGRPTGRTPYGYKSVYDENTGALITWVPDKMAAGCVRVKSRADVIRELFGRLEKGHALMRISRDFLTLGYRNRSGGVLSPNQGMHVAHVRRTVNRSYSATTIAAV